MLQQQEAMRRQAKANTLANEKRIKEIFRMDREMRERFIAVNDFIRDCEEKEHVAEGKIVVERGIHESIQTEVATINESMGVLEEFLRRLTATVEEFEPYERVIEEVVAESELYKNVKDMIDRCDALSKLPEFNIIFIVWFPLHFQYLYTYIVIAQVEIVEMEEIKIKEIELMREKMVQATNDAALTVMGLNNELSELEASYNASKAEVIKWGRVLVATKDCIAEKETLTFRLSDQIRQLYLLFCSRNGVSPDFRLEQYEEQLDKIKDEMDFFQEVVAYSKQLMVAEDQQRNGRSTATPRSKMGSQRSK